MSDILRSKFTMTDGLKSRLISTYPRALIEENDWGDTFWGKCNGEGRNQLGLLLMQIRRELLPPGLRPSSSGVRWRS